MKTADIWDAYGETENDSAVRVLDPGFLDFGGVTAFSGPAQTVKVFEDNLLVRQLLESPGEGKVLMVDGGGSLRCALVGDQLALLAIENGWSGLVVSGCIRDSAEIASMPIGIKALGTNPRKSAKRGHGVTGIPVEIGGVVIAPGNWIYADADGVLVSTGPLQQ